MPIRRSRDAAVRLLRPLAPLAAAAALSCGDRATSGPGIASPATVAVAPAFQATVADGPVIVLGRVAGWLVPVPTGDSAFAEAAFEGEEASLAFDVLVSGSEQRFVFRLDAFDGGEERVFAASDTILVRPGSNPPVEGLHFAYVARDAAVSAFDVQAGAYSVAIGDTVHLKARACCSGEQLFPVNAGWISRDPLVAGIGQGTGILTGVAPGRAWIVATLYNGTRDSVEIAVGDAIASVTIESPAPTLDAIGATAPLAAVARDAAGAPASAAILWRSLDPGVATVEPEMGLVAAAANGAARIVAEAGGKADTIDVVVEQVAVSLEVAAGADVLNAIGHETTLAAVARDAKGHPLAAPAVGFDPVPAAGGGALSITARESGSVVRAAAAVPGEALVEGWLHADSSGAVRLADTVRVLVRQLPASVALAPKQHAMYAGEIVALAAEVRDSAGATIPSPSLAWTTGDPGVATVDAWGVVTARGIGTTTVTGVAGEARGEAAIDVVEGAPVTRRWIGGDPAAPADWGSPLNWLPAGVPAAGDTVLVPPAPDAPLLAGEATVAALIVETGATLGGAGTLTVLGDVDAPSSVIAVRALRLRGSRGTETIGTLGTGHALLELIGTGQPIRSGLAYRDVHVSGSARLVGPEPVTFDGGLLIEGDAAELAPSGVALVVNGDLATKLGGVLAMTNDADDVTVKGAVTIAGGPTAAALVFGTLRVGRDFTVACTTAECFQPAVTGSFTVRFDGVERQTVSLALPGEPGAGKELQRFRHARVANASGVTFATGTPIGGDLLVDPVAVATIPAGVWVDVAGTLSIDRSGPTPGRIDNYGELYAGVDDTSGEVKPNPVLQRK